MIGRAHRLKCKGYLNERSWTSTVRKTDTLKKLEKDYVRSVIQLRDLYQQTSDKKEVDASLLLDVCLMFHKVASLYQRMECEQETIMCQQEENVEFLDDPDV